MNRRLAVPIAAVMGLAATALVLGALADRSSEAEPVPAGFGSGSVPPGTPLTDAWASVADVGAPLVPDGDNACDRGDPGCMRRILTEMGARLERLRCGHSAPFAFTYQEMTRGVSDAVVEPGFFDAPPITAHADALFARLYFTAYDNWVAGRVEDVPPVWRVTFDAADDGRTSAATDLLLGMNAHISRDLPYVVAQIASWQQEADAENSDFLRINDVIARVKGPMLAAAAERFDPSLAELDRALPALMADEDVEIIALWRNQALERGVRLSQAEGTAEREAVESEVERSSVATAVLLLNADSSGPASLGPGARDTYCEDQQRR